MTAPFDPPTTALVAVPVATTALGTIAPAGGHNPAFSYLKAIIRTESGRRAQHNALQVVARMIGEKLTGAPWTIATCPWAQLRYEHVNWFAVAFGERKKTVTRGGARGGVPIPRGQTDEPMGLATVRRHIDAIRGVMREAFRHQLIGHEQYLLIREVRAPRGSRLPTGRALTRAEVKALCDACDADDTPLGARDRALIALLCGCGLRGIDAAPLDLAHWNASTGVMRVIGKGNKERLAYVAGSDRAALDRWLEWRGDTPGPMFLRIVRSHGIPVATRRRLTVAGIRAALLRVARSCEGVQRFAAHDLRRTFITDMLRRGFAVTDVQKLAGHSDPGTTATYDRSPDVAIEAVAVEYARLRDEPT